jgi:glutamate/tyrosine decarboxylase-like PLP-dependent enzyme
MQGFPTELPLNGIGDAAAFALFSTAIQSRSARLGDVHALAHMDPPPLDIAARLVGLNAEFNQNMLHREVSPFATEVEARVIDWLAPLFGMRCGHFCSGSTLANLTAIWRAREAGAQCVIASVDAHISVAKAAHILGMPFRAVAVNVHGRLNRTQLGDVKDAVVVLTAGTTGRGVIDGLEPVACRWLHVDAAWAGPLRLTRFSARLDGIEQADSVAISAHKWLYQPKDSAIILFKSPDAQDAISFGGAYLATPNVGVQGSRSAAAVPLMATFVALGKSGLAALIERNMAHAEALAALIAADPRFELKQPPETAVLNWRLVNGATDAVLAKLAGTTSRTQIDGALWARQVAANPNADITRIWAQVASAS